MKYQTDLEVIDDDGIHVMPANNLVRGIGIVSTVYKVKIDINYQGKKMFRTS